MDENVKIIVSSVDKASKDLQKISKAGKTSFTELKSAVDLTKDALRDVYNAARKVYDLGKEGARLDTMSVKFDRLSESIGTTSDALLKDLRNATNGLMSDAELVQSATDLMTLGLAKTHDEAVRLATVSGKLGMDMNQLVLTLTNQTTMRFDALGVSVDGFEEKVKALEKTGMSASDAFGEAFLQQAEEQIKRVGDVSQTLEGQFMQIETEVKNVADAMKTELAPSVLNIAKSFTEMAKADGGLIDDMMELVKWIERNTHVTNVLNEAYEKNIITSWERTRAGSFLFGSEKKNLEQVKRIEDELRAYNARANDAAMSSRGFATAVGQVTDETETATNATERSTEALATAINSYIHAKNAMAGFRDRTREGVSALDELNKMQPNFASTIQAEIDKIDWKMLGGEDIQLAFGQIMAAFDDGLDPTKAKGALKDIELAADGVQAKMDGLTVDEFAKNIQDDVGGSLADAKAKADEIFAAIEAGTLREYIIHITYQYGVLNPPKQDVGNFIPPGVSSPKGQPKAAGGPVHAGVGYLVGERGPEMFIPATNGAIAPNRQLGGDTYNNITIYQLPGESGEALAAKVFAMISRANRRMSAGAGYAGA